MSADDPPQSEVVNEYAVRQSPADGSEPEKLQLVVVPPDKIWTSKDTAQVTWSMDSLAVYVTVVMKTTTEADPNQSHAESGEFTQIETPSSDPPVKVIKNDVGVIEQQLQPIPLPLPQQQVVFVSVFSTYFPAALRKALPLALTCSFPAVNTASELRRSRSRFVHAAARLARVGGCQIFGRGIADITLRRVLPDDHQ